MTVKDIDFIRYLDIQMDLLKYMMKVDISYYLIMNNMTKFIFRLHIL